MFELMNSPHSVQFDSTCFFLRLRFMSNHWLNLLKNDFHFQFSPAVILRTYLRLSETRSYESLGEVLWETAGAGATASSLRTAIAQAHNYPSSDVVLAKYFPEKFEWMVLTDSKVASKQSSIKKQVVYI